jgi:hypothetical protein
MYRKLLLSSFVLCFLLTAGAAFANPPDMSSIHDEAALLAQGWQRITDGVLQRKLGGNKIETFAFGREGSEWMVERSEDRLGFLLGEYEKYPTDQLLKVIQDVRRDIGQMKTNLEVSKITSADSFGGGESLMNCDISYGAHADAYPLSPGPGVGASASSYFNNNCYYWGIAQANVYVRATQYGVTTSDSAAQTQEGENVSAYAGLTRNGGEDCYSTAWARGGSDSFGFYETSDFNDDCPAPPLALDITGLTYVTIKGYGYRTITWNATVSGGVPPYGTINWYWDGYWVGSGSSFTETFYGDNWNWTQYVNLYATVGDSAGGSASDSHTTQIRYYATTICPDNTQSTGDSAQLIICPVDPL